MNRSFSKYHGSRVYIPLETDFARDARGSYLVHIHISDLSGEAEERIPVSDCVTGSLNRALEYSLLHAMRVIDEGIADSMLSRVTTYDIESCTV